MGGCQDYDPFFGYPEYWVPYYTRDPQRDHNFDDHLCVYAFVYVYVYIYIYIYIYLFI